MKSNKINFPVLFLLLLSLLFKQLKASEPHVLLDSANNAYASGNYQESIKFYNQVLADQIEAPEIYFNLGNAYFKSNNIPYAILNYERAKKKSPNDDDILVNLKIVNQKIVDKVEIIPTFFISDWQSNFMNLLSEKNWSVLCIVLFASFFIVLAIYLSVNKIIQKQLSFWVSILLLCATTLSFFMAKKQKMLMDNKTEAIIISPSITVKSSPSENGNKLFIIHEGLKVNIVETKDLWSEIKLANGNVGWLKTSSYLLI